MTPAEKITRLIVERGLNQKAAAKEFGVSYNSFRSYLRPEGGEKRPSIPGVDVALRIAHYLRVPSDWLFSDADLPPPVRGLEGVQAGELMTELLRRKLLLVRSYGPLLERYRGFKECLTAIGKRAIDTGEWSDADWNKARAECDSYNQAFHAYLPELQQWIAFEESLQAANVAYNIEPEASEIARIHHHLRRWQTDGPTVWSILWEWGTVTPKPAQVVTTERKPRRERLK